MAASPTLPSAQATRRAQRGPACEPVRVASTSSAPGAAVTLSPSRIATTDTPVLVWIVPPSPIETKTSDLYGGGAAVVMLYGISLVAGRFGTGSLTDVAQGVGAALATGTLDVPLALGLAFIFIGLAFKLKDPANLLGKGADRGITCALIPTSHPGVQIGRRHMPLNAVFQNGPNWGKDVFIPMDWIIGGMMVGS